MIEVQSKPSHASVHSAGVTLREAEAMLSATFNVFEHWRLTAEQAKTLLGSPSQPTFQRWKNRGATGIPMDTIRRCGDIVGIHQALRYMFADPARGYEWIKKPNSGFSGKSALDVMLAGSSTDLSAVRNYLDAERGAW